MSEKKQFVLVPCPIDSDGMYAHVPGHLPAGYHHLLVVDSGGEYYLFATFSGEILLSNVENAAHKLIGSDCLFVDPSFYQKNN